jgi:hypothetical protein
MVMSPTLKTEVGLHKMTLTLSDGQPMKKTYLFKILIIETGFSGNILALLNTGPPEFKTKLQL